MIIKVTSGELERIGEGMNNKFMVENTDLEKLKTTFDDLGIGYTENKYDFPEEYYKHIEIFLHYSNMTFVFNLNGKYITYDAVVD